MHIGGNFFDGIRKLLTYHNIISISGESGTGKTTFAIQLVGTILSYEPPFEDSCIWVQASEKFSLKRLIQIFQEEKEKLEYIQNNIYIIPQNNPIRTYEQQGSLIQQLMDISSYLPPSLKYIVIDNVSHHLRYKLTCFHNPKNISSILNSFYETQLMPLILFCKQNEIILILIHEVSYNPKDQENKPFFYRLYRRIKTIDIVLNKLHHTEKKNLYIYYNKVKWNFQFIIEPSGITFL